MAKRFNDSDKDRIAKLKKEIIKLIADVTENDVKDVKGTKLKTNFIQGTDVDSLMVLEIISAIEKKYHIEIQEENLPQLGSLDDMVILIDQLLRKQISVVKTESGNADKTKIIQKKSRASEKTKAKNQIKRKSKR